MRRFLTLAPLLLVLPVLVLSGCGDDDDGGGDGGGDSDDDADGDDGGDDDGD